MVVAFNEWNTGPTLTFTATGQQAQRTGTISWADINDFGEELFPVTTVTGTENIVLPTAAFPGRTWLRAASCSFEPFPNRITGTDANGIATYELAKATIRYETLKLPRTEEEAEEDGDPVPFLTHRWSIGGEFMTLPNTSLRWADDGTEATEDVNAGVMVPTIEHQITWPRVVSPPFAAMRTLIGTVNNAEMNFATGPIALETLLFIGAELQRDIMSDGSRAWQVTYRFSERRIEEVDDQDEAGGWNHFWRPEVSSSGWYRLERDDNSSATSATGAENYQDELAIYKRRNHLLLFPTA